MNFRLSSSEFTDHASGLKAAYPTLKTGCYSLEKGEDGNLRVCNRKFKGEAMKFFVSGGSGFIGSHIVMGLNQT